MAAPPGWETKTTNIATAEASAAAAPTPIRTRILADFFELAVFFEMDIEPPPPMPRPPVALANSCVRTSSADLSGMMPHSVTQAS